MKSKRTVAIAFCFPWLTVGALALSECKNPAATGGAAVEGGLPLVACVSQELLKGDDTFEGIAAACGGAAIAEVVGIVETLSLAADAGGAATVLTQKASAAHHKNAGK
jgi:hypothetical protein